MWLNSTQIASTVSRSGSLAWTVHSRSRRSNPLSTKIRACSQAARVKARTQPSWWSRLWTWCSVSRKGAPWAAPSR